jgi:hypothetical protein
VAVTDAACCANVAVVATAVATAMLIVLRTFGLLFIALPPSDLVVTIKKRAERRPAAL